MPAVAPEGEECPFCQRCQACGGTGRVRDAKAWDIEEPAPRPAFLGDPFPHPEDL